MPKQIGFDNEKYLREQRAAILARVKTSDPGCSNLSLFSG